MRQDQLIYRNGKSLPERPAQLIVVHVWFALPLPPQSGQLLGVPDDKLAPLAPPADGSALAAAQQLQQEVPQLDLPGTRRPGWFVGPVRKQHCCGKEMKCQTIKLVETSTGPLSCSLFYPPNNPNFKELLIKTTVKYHEKFWLL